MDMIIFKELTALTMGRFIVGFALFVLVGSCQFQGKNSESGSQLGGPCEGCEAALEYGDKILTSVDTLSDFGLWKHQMMLYGTVYQSDGKTPAEGVIIYIYHTDRDGLYTAKSDAKGWGKKHGHWRGWAKTDKDGKYAFYTIRPVAYPDGSEPQHIHMTVKEPGKIPYYIDSVVFRDDPIFWNMDESSFKNRGGAGDVQPVLVGDIWKMDRDIILW